MLIAYPSSSGENTTISPRLATDHSEPVYSSDIHIEMLGGTGLVNDTLYVYNGRCTNCRSWDGGSIDVTSTSQAFVWSAGPGGDTSSDDAQAGLRIHDDYGTFTMDMKQATGAAGVQTITADSQSVGTTEGSSHTGQEDWATIMHALIMVFCFIGLLPFGIAILRIGGLVKWHGFNQAIFLVGVVVGSVLGITISTEYNRVSWSPGRRDTMMGNSQMMQSKSFSNPHQIIGILILMCVIAQFVLGFKHHRIFKKTQKTTKLAPVHVWLGRFIAVFGVVNAFL